MTFREMNFTEKRIPIDIDHESSLWQMLVENQGPIIKMWFAMMLVYLIAVIAL